MMAPQMPSGVEVASYKTYLEAQAAVDFLSDSHFNVKAITIVGTDLHLVERVTGRLTMGRAALSGVGSGMLWGGFIGLMMSFGNSAAATSVPWLLLGMGGGALLGMVMATLSYALSGGRRDFTSQSQVVASRYAVLASVDVDRAFELLQSTRGNQMRPAPRKARRAQTGPTEYGSRPDEQPRFGVRVNGGGAPQSADSAPAVGTAQTADVPPMDEATAGNAATAPEAAAAPEPPQAPTGDQRD